MINHKTNFGTRTSDMNNKIRVGYQHNDYGTLRMFIGLPFKNVVHRKCWDVSTLPRYLHYKLTNRINAFLQNVHYDPGFHNIDVFHFWNSISFSHKPWVVTYETALPRWNTNSLLGIRRLANNSCKKLIAISQNAYDIQCHSLDKFPEYKDVIRNKMIVMHPAQKVLINTIDEKRISLSGLIDFTFTGTDFFRKGGREVLLAFDKLLNKDYPIRLNIVSKLDYGDFASKTTKEDQEHAKSIILKHPERISHFGYLPNNEVINLFKRTHVGLLPSYADNYGSSVLEAQAYGCPVITTNMRAMPENNNEKIGWLIDIPMKQFGYAKIHSVKERLIFSEILTEGLVQTIDHICQKPEIVLSKGKLALEKIKRQHSPENNAKVLEEVYCDALHK